MNDTPPPLQFATEPSAEVASLPTLTVVIPVGLGDAAWQSLLGDLAEQLPIGTPVLLAGQEHQPQEFDPAVREAGLTAARWLTCRPGRAAQLNDAAAAGDGSVWFLHADTRLPPHAVEALQHSLARSPDSLHYFGLRFYDGPRRLRLNELGVRLRCRLFGLPFGDQGFCLSGTTLRRLGGFDEWAAFGEDHLLVWSARRLGIPLVRVPASLSTSGRKYAEGGWTRTTLRHLRLTAEQAAAERRRGSAG